MVVDCRKCAGQYPNCRLELYILVRCGASWAAMIWRTLLTILSGPGAFMGGVKAMAWRTSLSVISGNAICSWYSLLWISWRSGSGGMGKKVALRRRSLSSGSLDAVSVVGSFNIGVVVGATSPRFLAHRASF